MCHHFSMISCYIRKGDRFKPLDPSGEFLVFEAKPEILFFLLEEKEKIKGTITFQRGDMVSITFPGEKKKTKRKNRNEEMKKRKKGKNMKSKKKDERINSVSTKHA